MELPSYIKPKPIWFKFIPILNQYTANSLYPFIFVPKDIFENLKTKEPNQKYLALLAHEGTHYERQKQTGWLKFALKYLFIPKFRLKEELIAVKVGIKYLKIRRYPFDFEEKSKKSSQNLYLWPISKYYKKARLEQIWNEIEG